MKYIKNDYLYYEKEFISEKCEWVILIHGFVGSMRTFEKQRKEFKKEYNLLLIDLRGHGKSNLSLEKKKITLDLYINDIIKLLNYLDIKQAHFLSVSISSVIIMRLQKKMPSIVKSLILCGGVVHFKRNVLLLLKTANIFYFLKLTTTWYRILAKLTFSNQKHKALRILFVRNAKRISLNSFQDRLMLFRTISKNVKLLHSQPPDVPCLFIMGSLDSLYLNAAQKFVKENKKNMKIKIIKEASHVCNIDNPKKFNEIFLNYLNLKMTQNYK